MPEPLVIEIALNGRVTKDENPHVPLSPAEMAESIEACLQAGATVVHAHASDAYYGNEQRHASEPYREAFAPVLERHPGAILYPTLPAAGPHLPMPVRYAHIRELADAGILKMAPIDPGTMNWSSFSAGGGNDEEMIYQNTFGDVRYAFEFCNVRNLGCTMSIFEPGFLRLVLAHARAGTMPKASVVKLEFSSGRRQLFGMPANRQGLEAYLCMLEGVMLPWMISYRDGDLMDGLGRLALERGGHVRVGIHDYGGPRRPRNEELVAEIVELALSLGRRPATQQEALAMLALA